MKRLFAFIAAFVFIACAGATFNIAQANRSIAPELTTTPSSTFTLTPTETSDAPSATATETLAPCTPPPPAAELLAPQHQAVLKNKTRIKLRWSKVDCANKYRILVRRGSRDGESVARGHTKKTKAFVELEAGYSYFWSIKACINNRCARSTTRKFMLPAPPTPTPSLTPTRAATRPKTPTGPNPGGTPVPGTPPRQLNDYRGPGVYLSDDGSRVYYADCGASYVRYGQGSGIATITLWFYPNEGISYESRTLPGLVVQKGSVRANGEGYAEITFDTSSWPGEHYHIDFTGQTSKAHYCGHFQLMTNESGGTGETFAPHTPQELERIRQMAGTESE